MAQIRIEEKKSTNPFPWILGLLLLGLLIWGVAEAFEEADEVDMVDNEEMVEPVTEVGNDVVEVDEDVDYAAEINTFMTYTNNMEGEMGLDHEFTHDAITRLSNAVSAVAAYHKVELSDNLDRARQLADEITEDPYATDHADMIRMAAINITESLERIDKWANDLENKAMIDNLRKEAQAINAATLTLNQKEDVRSFFGAAREVLANM